MMVTVADLLSLFYFVRFKSPYLLLLLIPALFFLIHVMLKKYVTFHSKKDEREYQVFVWQRRRLRIFVFLSRFIIIVMLIIALAGPFIVTRTLIPGEKQVKILSDESTSFELFDQTLAQRLEDNLKDVFPTTSRIAASGTDSKMGDALLASLSGNDNIFLVSDGNVNNGRDLAEIVLYAIGLNSTVNGVNLRQKKFDSSIKVLGPKKTVSSVENVYYVEIKNPSSMTNKITVSVDGKIVLRKDTTDELIQFTQTFVSGEHEIVAKIENPDHFNENNIFYKVVEVLPQPKVLFVSSKASPMQKILDELYQTTTLATLPSSLDEINKYSTVILNDVRTVSTAQTEILTPYVIDGNGLVVVGGINSYDFGTYENSFFETLLPVKIGRGDNIEGDTNVVLLLDISGSTGSGFGDDSVVDVEKAQAISILNDLRPEDKVAVVAFNAQAFPLTNLLKVGTARQLMINQIERLNDGGGTVIANGLQAGVDILKNVVGSRQIVLISDGQTQLPKEGVAVAKEAARLGIRIYTVGIGDLTNENYMKEIAISGFGNYFRPGESQRLRISFDRETPEGKDLTDGFRLGISDINHFIGSGLDIDATVTGFNQVVPKSAAQSPITTTEGNPIITVWRFGLGKVAAMTTDDGSRYAGELLSPKNSQVISRTINWAIGDLSRGNPSFVDIRDTSIDRPIDVWIKSPTPPEYAGYAIEKVDKNLYKTTFTPQKQGFQSVLGKKVAVNYNSEYLEVGVNPQLQDLVLKSGGLMVDVDDLDTIKKLIESSSFRTKTSNTFLRWPLAIIALIIFIIELAIRRWFENEHGV